MDSRRAIFEWPPRERRAASEGGERALRGSSLAERLVEVSGDRVASAAALIVESAELAWSWVRERPFDWRHVAAADELEEGLAAWAAAHGWRAPAALFVDALRRTLAWAAQSGLHTPREALLEELAQWMLSDEQQEHEHGATPRGEGPWDGEPLGEGRRLPRRAELAPWALRALERRECVLVHGFSETVAGVLEAAHAAGLEPQVLLTEGGPELGGKRLARRLANAGLAPRLGYDLAWMGQIASCDRVWVGTESIGAGAFVARAGTRLLFEEAHRHGVACEVLATRDKLFPGGACDLPQWGAEEPWILWSDPPAGVVLERQPFETVPLALVDAFWTEAGRESARELVLRGLPPEPLAPLGRSRLR